MSEDADDEIDARLPEWHAILKDLYHKNRTRDLNDKTLESRLTNSQ